eukprot:8743047-Prorocentrum_lima.AAC.1
MAPKRARTGWAQAPGRGGRDDVGVLKDARSFQLLKSSPSFARPRQGTSAGYAGRWPRPRRP